MTWDDDKRTFRSRPEIPTDERLTADEWNAHVSDQKDHAERHEAGGVDELVVDGLAGVLADPQPPQEEAVEDFVAGLLGGGDKVAVAYDDAAGSLTVNTSALDTEEVEDAVNALVAGGDGVTTSYDDANNTLTLDVTVSDFAGRLLSGDGSNNLQVNEGDISHDAIDQTTISEGDHRTTEQVQDIVNALLEAGDKLSLTYDDANDTLTVDTSALDTEEVEDAVDTLVTEGDGVATTYDDANDTLTFSLAYISKSNNTISLDAETTTATGGVEFGPQEAIVSDSTVHGILRSDDDLSAGSDVEVVEWDAGVGRRSLKAQADGNGGVYGLRSPLAGRVTNQLSFESESLSDTTFRTQFATTSHSASLSGFPRQLTVSHDGSDGDVGGVKSSVVVSPDSVGVLRLTFHNVDFSANNRDNELRVGVTTADVGGNIFTTGDAVFFDTANEGQTQDDFFAISSGQETADNTAGGRIPWNEPRDVVIEIGANESRYLADGDLRATIQQTPSGLLTPFVQIRDIGTNTTGETVSVEQITVEEL